MDIYEVIVKNADAYHKALGKKKEMLSRLEAEGISPQSGICKVVITRHYILKENGRVVCFFFFFFPFKQRKALKYDRKE